ncbi:AAA family ATPase [Pedosphaera parvula]
MEAIEQSENAFNTRLMDGFADAIKELEELNYPGIADPKLRIATLLRPTDGLNHSAALQYELGVQAGNTSASQLRLPEEYNGLGYQNLISIVFRLMAFRDSWMRKGKAAKMSVLQTEKKTLLAPLHLVIVEEPEAHLHPQVQQVFVRKAYDILRTHPDLEDKTTLRTQLLVSTHSSHVAHECPFSSLRYFRRLAAPTDGVPTSAVINLSEVFGPNDKTEKFVTRYIQAVHCDLFFADGAILVEGDAERILVPHFIRKHFPKLHRSYVTVMQVGGSHAHRLQSLIEHLGLTTLIITDIDTGEAGGHHKSIPPMLGDGQVTNNATLKMWHPREKLFDKLIELDEKAKVKTSDFPQFSVRVAYQIPVSVQLEPTATVAEALPSTFEDALAFENLELFRNTGGNVIEGGDLVERFKAILNTPPVITELAKEISEAVRKTKGKAEFALDLLLIKEDLAKVKVPKYIENGLEWLECQLSENEQLVLQSAKTSTSAPAASVAPTEEALSPATVLA